MNLSVLRNCFWFSLISVLACGRVPCAAPVERPVTSIGVAVQSSKIVIPLPDAKSMDCVSSKKNDAEEPKPFSRERIVATSLEMPVGLNVAEQLPFLRKDYLWLDVENLVVTKPLKISADSRILITARTVTFAPNAYIQVVLGQGGKRSTGVEGQALRPQCAALPADNEATVLIFTETVEAPSLAGVLHDGASNGKAKPYAVRANRFMCANKTCTLADIAGIYPDNTRTALRDISDPGLLDAIRRLVRWPDLAYQATQFRFAQAPYDVAMRDELERALVSLRDIRAYELRAPLLFRIQDSLELVRQGRNLFGQDQYFLPALNHQHLDRYLTDEIGKLEAIRAVDAQVAKLEQGLQGVSNDREFIKGRLRDIAARRTNLNVDEEAREAELSAAATNVQVTQDRLTDKVAAYELAIQREKWNQQRLQRKARDRAKTAQALTAVGVVAGAVATSGAGGEAVAGIASAAQPMAAAYSAYAQAQSSAEMCGKKVDFLKSVGFAVEQYQGMRERSNELGQQLKTSANRVGDLGREGRCFAKNSKADGFGKCFAQATESNKKASQEGNLKLPDKYDTRTRAEGFFTRSKEISDEIEKMRDLQWEQPLSMPECPEKRPMPEHLRAATDEYDAAKAEAESAAIAFADIATALSKINAELVTLADLEASLATVDGQKVAFGPEAQEALDGLVAERRSHLLYLGNIIEAHRRWTYLLSLSGDDNQRRYISDAGMSGAAILAALASRTDALTEGELEALTTRMKSYQETASFTKVFLPNRKEKTETLTQRHLLKANWQLLQQWYLKVQSGTTRENLVLDVPVPIFPGLPRVTTVRNVSAIGKFEHPGAAPTIKMNIYLSPFGMMQTPDIGITYCLGRLSFPEPNLRLDPTPIQNCGFKKQSAPFAWASGMALLREQEFKPTLPPAPSEMDLSPWSGVMRLVFLAPSKEDLPENVGPAEPLIGVEIQTDHFVYW